MNHAPAAPAAPPADLAAKIAEAIEKNPREMTPVMARQFGVPEAVLLRHFPAHLSTELEAGPKAIDLIKRLEALGKVHVIASNEGCTLEAYGHFGGFSLTGPYFNVQTPTLDMHIRHGALVNAFAIIKPSHQDGQMTYSVQFFAPSGNAVFKVFLYKSVSEQDSREVEGVIAEWEKIRAEFALAK